MRQIPSYIVGTMEMVHGMRQQILARLRSLGLIRSHGAGDIKDLNRNSKNWAVIKAVVGAGLYPNLVKVFIYSQTRFSKESNCVFLSKIGMKGD